MSAPPELRTLRDFIRYAVSRFEAAGLHYGHGCATALDEAGFLVLRALHLPPDLPSVYGDAALIAEEREQVHALIERRVAERVPTAYLLGEAWFAGRPYFVSPAVLVPRSPFAELIDKGFQPWLGDREPARILDLCTGSGCIAIATALAFPGAEVTASDLSAEALALAKRNAVRHGVAESLRLVESDGFEALQGEVFDLILSNPPYVGEAEYAALPAEFHAEPKLGLTSGEDGLDLPLRILAEAPAHLSADGLLILEVGNSEIALNELLPMLPGVWVEFEHGGGGVLAIEAHELRAIADDVAALRAARAGQGA